MSDLAVHQFVAGVGVFHDPPLCAACSESVSDPIHDVPSSPVNSEPLSVVKRNALGTIARYRAGEITERQACDWFGVDRLTFRRALDAARAPTAPDPALAGLREAAQRVVTAWLSPDPEGGWGNEWEWRDAIDKLAAALAAAPTAPPSTEEREG